MFGFSAGELLVVLVIALIFIGPKKLPELARGLGKGIKEFNKAKNDMMEQIHHRDETDSETNKKVAQSDEVTVEDSLTKKNSLENSESVTDHV